MRQKNSRKAKNKKLSKSEERRHKSHKKNSTAAREGVKYLVTFLKSMGFRGVAYEKGDTIELSEGDPKISSKRTDLKIERLGK
jgi:hypothetical protein